MNLPTVEQYIKASYPCLYIPSNDGIMTEDNLIEIMSRLGVNDTNVGVWTSTHGFQVSPPIVDPDRRARDRKQQCLELMDTLKYIEELPPLDLPDFTPAMKTKKTKNEQANKPIVAILNNVRTLLDNTMVVQALLDAIFACRSNGSTIILVGAWLELPPELKTMVTYCPSSLPTTKQITGKYTEMITELKRVHGENITIPKEKKKLKALIEEAARCATGLEHVGAENALTLSFVISKKIDVKVIQAQKEQEIRKSDVLEYINTEETMNTVGGFDAMKQWFEKRQCAFTKEARDYKLPYPKGVLIAGIAGTGKSLAAKAIGNFLKLPTIRLDIGKVFRSLVGESEFAMRNALRMVEALSPCVLWIDELDKGMAGMQGSGDLDSGVLKRVIQTLLTWRQETQSPVVLVATANDISNVPSMVYRKGRLDEIWFVNLPDETEREQIFEIHLKKFGRDAKNFDMDRLASESDNLTGSEIEALIADSMFSAFSEGKEVDTDDILNALQDVVPQATRDEKEVAAIQKWGKANARNVSHSMLGMFSNNKNKKKVSRRAKSRSVLIN